MKIIGMALCVLLTGCISTPRYSTPLERMGLTENAYQAGYYVDKRSRHNAGISGDEIYETMLTNPLFVYHGLHTSRRDQLHLQTFGQNIYLANTNKLKEIANVWQPSLVGKDEPLTFETLSRFLESDIMNEFTMQRAIFVHRLKNIDGAILGLAYNKKTERGNSAKGLMSTLEHRFFGSLDSNKNDTAHMFNDCEYTGYSSTKGFFYTNYRVSNLAADLYKSCNTPFGDKTIRIATASRLKDYGMSAYMEIENSLWNSTSAGPLNRHKPGNDPEFPPVMIMKSFLGENILSLKYQTFAAAYKVDQEQRLYFHYISDGYESRQYITYNDLERFFNKYQGYLDEFDRKSR